MQLRIVGGRLSGRRIAGPVGDGTRPTSERVREALMSALEARGVIAGARVADLFCGTGALGIETLSRGAASVICVDRDRRMRDIAQRNGEALSLSSLRAISLDLSRARGAAAKLAQLGPFDLVLADPPYDRAEALPSLFEALATSGAVAPGGLLVAEHAHRSVLEWPSALASVASYRYGDTAVTFVEPTDPSA